MSGQSLCHGTNRLQDFNTWNRVYCKRRQPGTDRTDHRLKKHRWRGSKSSYTQAKPSEGRRLKALTETQETGDMCAERNKTKVELVNSTNYKLQRISGKTNHVSNSARLEANSNKGYDINYNKLGLEWKQYSSTSGCKIISVLRIVRYRTPSEESALHM